MKRLEDELRNSPGEVLLKVALGRTFSIERHGKVVGVLSPPPLPRPSSTAYCPDWPGPGHDCPTHEQPEPPGHDCGNPDAPCDQLCADWAYWVEQHPPFTGRS